MTTTTKVEPHEQGHGFVAIVLIDGVPVYSSADAPNDVGCFGEENDAADHGKTWADALDRMAAATAELKLEREHLAPAKTAALFEQRRADQKLADKLRKAAGVAGKNAEARLARIEALAHGADYPRMRVVWTDKSNPSAVELEPVASAWDYEFVAEDVEDPRQLSLPGLDWTMDRVTDDDGTERVSRVSGRGDFAVEVDDRWIIITVGDHELRGHFPASGLDYQEQEQPTDPFTEVDITIGGLKDKPLRERIARCSRAATLLGLFELERAAKKPRKRVLAFLDEHATEHDDPRLVADMTALEDGAQTTMIKPDLAAAALLSSTPDEEADTKRIELLVPMCMDAEVLADILDNELERGDDSRDAVVEALRASIDEIVDGD